MFKYLGQIVILFLNICKLLKKKCNFYMCSMRCSCFPIYLYNNNNQKAPHVCALKSNEMFCNISLEKKSIRQKN